MTRRPLATETAEGQFLSHECESLSTPEPAVAALLEVETFRDTHVGYAGVVPAEVCAFVTVLKQPDAVQRFKRVLEAGRRAGQLYALCGLYLTSRISFEAALARLESADEQVWTQFGCIIMRHPLNDLLDRIRSGELPERFDRLARSAAFRGTQSNIRLNPTVGPVTAVAKGATAAPAPPAG